MTNFRVIAAACLISGATVSAAQAQGVTPVTQVEQGPPVASQRFDTITYGVTASLDIAKDEAETNLAAGGEFTSTTQDTQGPQVQNALLWKVGAQIPLAGNGNLADDATLDFLDGGLTFTAGLTLKHFTSDVAALGDPVFLQYIDEAVAACQAKPDRTAEQCARLRNPQLPPGEVIRGELPELYQRLNRNIYSPFWTIGVRGSLGIRNFDYVLPGTLSEQDITHESYSVALAGVYYPADRVSAFKLEAEYGEAYEADDETIVCRTVIVVPADDCVKAVPTAPTQKESLVLRAEYRRYLGSIDGKSGFGFALTGSVDTLSGDRAVEIPLYYNLGANSPILPGLKFGYKRDSSKPSDEDEELTVSVFLKTAFSL